MAEKHISRVTLNGTPLVDISHDTVTPETLKKDETAHNRAGAPIVGTYEGGGDTSDCYKITDSVSTDIVDADYIPFNDVSDSEVPKKKILFSEIKSKLGNIFPSLAKTYTTDDNADSTIADGDYLPFNDVSDSSEPKKKITLSNLINKLKDTFATITQLNGKQDTLTFDNEPILDSNNPVKSGGVYNYSIPQYGTDIPANSDLNDYKNPGVYNIRLDATAATISNMPIQRAGKLIVMNIAGTRYREQQFIPLTPNNGLMFQRLYNNDNDANTWGAWKQYASMDDVNGKQDILTFDNKPTQSSNNPVKSGGIYDVSPLQLGNAIPDNADLNSYNTEGSYYIFYTATAQTLSNIPIAVAGKLLVMKARSGGNIIQVFYTYNNNIIYQRTSDDNGVSWSVWSYMPSYIGYGIGGSNNADFNNYKTTGVFNISSDAMAATISNIPIQKAGKLIVVNTVNGNYLIQQYMPLSVYNGVMYQRYLNNSVWSSWKKYATTDDVDDVQAQINDIVNVYNTKNLLPLKNNTWTSNGLTFTCLANGGINVNGTATAITAYNIRSYLNNGVVENDYEDLIGKSFILSGCPSGGSDSTYRLQFYRYSGDNSVYDYGNGTSAFTVTENSTGYVNIAIYVKNGVTMNNLVFYPMLRLGSMKDATFEPYILTNRQLTDKLSSYYDLTSDTNVITKIQENTDLNTLTTAGTYYCGTHAISQTLSNCPIRGAFKLKVDAHVNTNILSQTITIINANLTNYPHWVSDFKRIRNDSLVWSEWNRVASENDLDDYVRWDEQNLYGSKNLLPNICLSKEYKGVTFTHNADGTITANGTASSVIYYGIDSITSDGAIGDYIPFPYSGTFTLTGCPSGGTNETYGIGLEYKKISDSGYTGISEYGSGINVTLESDHIIRTFIRIRSGVTVNNLVFKPMIRLASIDDDTFVPYVAPNSQTLSVSDNALTGCKNFIRYPYEGVTKTQNGITFTVNSNGSITVNGTSTADAYFAIADTARIHLLPGLYLLTGLNNSDAPTTSDAYIYINFVNGESKWHKSNGSIQDRIINSTQRSNITCGIYVPSGKTISNYIFYPMLRLFSDKNPAYVRGSLSNENLSQMIYNKTYIGTCNTAASDRVKIAYIDKDFVLVKGVRIGIKYSYPNSFISSGSGRIALNVNATGEKNIYYGGGYLDGAAPYVYGMNARYIYYVYDGTYWVWDGYSAAFDGGGLQTLEISIPDNGGKKCYLLFADVTTWYNSTTTGQTTYCFEGFLMLTRGSGNMRNVTVQLGLGVSYQKVTSIDNLNLILKTTNSNYVPCILQDSTNNKYYLAIYCQLVGNIASFIGRWVNINPASITQNNFVICTDTSGTLPSGWSRAISWGSKYHKFTLTQQISTRALGFGRAICTTAASTTAKIATLDQYTLKDGGYVTVRFDYDVPANATLNINSEGAKAIYYRGSAITAGKIKAGDRATFIYNGEQYELIANDRWGG